MLRIIKNSRFVRLCKIKSSTRLHALRLPNQPLGLHYQNQQLYNTYKDYKFNTEKVYETKDEESMSNYIIGKEESIKQLKTADDDEIYEVGEYESDEVVVDVDNFSWKEYLKYLLFSDRSDPKDHFPYAAFMITIAFILSVLVIRLKNWRLKTRFDYIYNARNEIMNPKNDIKLFGLGERPTTKFKTEEFIEHLGYIKENRDVFDLAAQRRISLI